MRRLIIGISSIIAIVAVLLFAAPSITAWLLQKSLGSRSTALVLQNARQQNTAALLALGRPVILADIPTELPQQIIKDELTRATSDVELQDGWKIVLRKPVEVAFLTNAVRGRASISVEKLGIGTAALDISIDGIPHLSGNDIIVDLTVTSAAVNKLSLLGLQLPWPVPQVVTETVQESLDTINTKLRPITIPAKIPPALIPGSPASAILLTQEAIAVLIGERTNPPRSQLTGSYENDFIAQAKTISPDYAPGIGLIAVAGSQNELPDTSEALRQSSIAINLAATQQVLGTDQLNALSDSSFGAVTAVTVLPSYFEQQMEIILRDAISKLHPDGIEISIRPEDVHAKTIDGALEATAQGSAKFSDGALDIDFKLTAWGVVDPDPNGLLARYAVRDFQVQRMSAKWNDLKAPLKVENSQALASLILKAVTELPKSTLKIPSISIKLPKQDGPVRVEFAHDANGIDFRGRSTFLSIQRVIILSNPTIAESGPGTPVTPVPVAPQNFDKLSSLNLAAYKKIFATDPPDALNIGMTKAAAAHLVNEFWKLAGPSVIAELSTRGDIPKEEIKAIPGDASCKSMCPSIQSCGDILSCKIDVCGTVASEACHSVCPGGRFNPICRKICKTVSKKVCHKEDDSNCLDRIQKCGLNAGICAATWSSGLRLTCEAAIAAINATDFHGLANISGSYLSSGGGKTLSDISLEISPNLSSAILQATVTAQAHVEASLDITWTDFGNFLACPSGKLSAGFNIAAPLQTLAIPTSMQWSGGGETPLKLTLSPIGPDLQLAASESPLFTLAKSNPGLLVCPLGQAVVGLSLIAKPSITQDLLASAIRKAAKDDNSTVAAIIDGKYKKNVEIKPVEVSVSGFTFLLNGKDIQLMPRLTESALIFASK